MDFYRKSRMQREKSKTSELVSDLTVESYDQQAVTVHNLSIVTCC
jgi:hypothetical protein